PPDDPNRRRLDAVGQAVARAASLTNGLLGFARRQPLKLAPVNLAALLADTAAMLRRTVDPRLEIVTEVIADCQPVLGHAGASHRPAGTRALIARARWPAGGRRRLSGGPPHAPAPPHHPEARPGPFARLSVADTGTGIAPEHFGRVFEPFFTTKPPDEGTGL